MNRIQISFDRVLEIENFARAESKRSFYDLNFSLITWMEEQYHVKIQTEGNLAGSGDQVKFFIAETKPYSLAAFLLKV